MYESRIYLPTLPGAKPAGQTLCVLTYVSRSLTLVGMQDVLDAVVEPRRREILRLLGSVELPAGAIAAHFPDARARRSHSTSAC